MLAVACGGGATFLRLMVFGFLFVEGFSDG